MHGKVHPYSLINPPLRRPWDGHNGFQCLQWVGHQPSANPGHTTRQKLVLWPRVTPAQSHHGTLHILHHKPLDARVWDDLDYGGQVAFE